MLWLLLAFIVGSTIAFLVYANWRKWIKPWRQFRELVSTVGRGEQPRTFLIDGGDEPRRVGIALEEIFLRQRQLDQQIAQRESGTETILGAMEDGLLVVDSNRRVILVNTAFRKIFGAREIQPGEPLRDVLRDVDADRVIEQALRNCALQQSELNLAERQFQISAVPMRHGDNGGSNGVVVLFHDITELKRLDQVRSDFVANVSHELRTPLSILRGYIETLLDAPETSRAELQRILGVMERHSKRLGLLVEDLLTLAQLESPNANLQLANIRLDELFLTVARDWEKKFADKKLKVAVDLAPSLPSIRADESRVQEILYNLLDNAVKYTPADGEIRLRIEQRNGEVALSVSDTGAGISKDDLARVFERFYRADKARSRELGGTGLGLSIVKHIAQLHGGRVEAESELGRGTTIRVLLPVHSNAVTQT
jgi:two-component system, OmpR family, phosphate regulon sensor histidine kinase PhoR